MTILQNIQNINWQGIRESKLYRRFASLKTSCILLCILVGFYTIGTIFPQDAQLDDYIKSGGRFISFVIFFDLLNIFNTPVFLIIAILLFINLVICTFERFLMLRSQNKTAAEDWQFTPAYTFPLDINQELESAEESVREIFKKELRFKEKASQTYGIYIMEKGWSYRWLTWAYHIAILFCFLGFLMTYLFSFEDEITLYPGEVAVIKPAAASRWNKSWGNSPQIFDFKLELAEFITEYNQLPKLEYPADKLSRLAFALGWKDPQYTLKEESYFPKDWKSRLKAIKGNMAVLEKTIEVNDPLSYQGITFYQAAYKQMLKIQVDDNPISFETETGKEIIIPGIDGMLKFGTIRIGTLFKKDGGMEKIRPFTEVTLVKKESSGKLAPDPPLYPLQGGDKGVGRGTETENIGKLEQDGAVYIDNKRISIKEFKEASILSYRYDPGVPLLWWSGIVVLLAMSFRVFGAWYRITYRIEEKDGASHLLIKVNTKGLIADEERLIKRLKHLLEKMTEPIDLDTPV
ncbi:MAG: cytochrome c biogenesis protein ResB [Deltaproteobacteria bacterium]|nr:cytochrome c biogenesis protein ResB [Deltaproteobacteria bacterium]